MMRTVVVLIPASTKKLWNGRPVPYDGIMAITGVMADLRVCHVNGCPYAVEIRDRIDNLAKLTKLLLQRRGPDPFSAIQANGPVALSASLPGQGQFHTAISCKIAYPNEEKSGLFPTANTCHSKYYKHISSAQEKFL